MAWPQATGIALGLAALAAVACSTAATTPRYSIAGERYDFTYDKATAGEAKAFTWITRRDPCFLVSGDSPRVALARTFREPSIAPATIKLGDLRVRCVAGGKSVWLDEAVDLKARFHAWGTEHAVNLAPEIPASLTMTASTIENRGIAVSIRASSNSDAPVDLELELYFGGLTPKGRPADTPPYFVTEPADSQGDTISLDSAVAVLSDPAIAVKTVVATDPSGEPSVTPAADDLTGNRVHLRYRLALGRSPQSVRFIAYQSEQPSDRTLSPAKAEEYIEATKRYYESLLAPYEIRTPDAALNAGFYTALVNFHWVYQKPSWLEGIHWWAAYLATNYQISAAVDLGEFDRARDALVFWADRPEGPGPMLRSDGVADMPPGSHYQFEEGLLYYIEQLYRYWRATDDSETLARVWKPTVDNLEKMLKVRDPEGNGLLNYHMGSNGFLYQADHLSLPGDASSPSIIASDCLDKMAEMADARGDSGSAALWRRRAEYMRSEILRRLWSPADGKFVGCVDTQGLAMRANYYTDFVFPQLYSKLPAEHSWLSLKTLDSTLRVGDDLMRVGNLLPSLFGNNNVMPVQMSEAAEAYCRAGRPNDGRRLLHGAALACTIHTDSPGSVPERMSDDGKGLPDYVFGNPIGAFLRGVVSGLFGVERRAESSALVWRPSIPAEWERSGLTLPGLALSVTGEIEARRYSAKLDREQGLEFEAPLLGRRIEAVTNGGGRALAYTIEAHPGGGFIRVRLPASREHTIVVTTEPGPAPWKVPGKPRPGAKVEWRLPSAGLAVVDPQAVFDEFRIDGDVLRGRLSSERGKRTFFLRDRAAAAVVPVEIDLGGRSEKKPAPVTLAEPKRHIKLDALFNADSISSRNFWNWENRVLDMSGKVESQGGESILTVGGCKFSVRPTGKNIALIEAGTLDFYTQQMKPTDKPSALVIPIGEKARGVEMLLVSEWLVRLTGMKVGDILLHYADGSTADVPLVHGKNIGSVNDRFAADVTHLELKWLYNIYAYSVEADPTRVLESVELRLYAADGSLGILAANVAQAR